MTDAGFPQQGEDALLVAVASIEELADEWEDLAVRTAAPPFARPGWIRAWWSAFGKGETYILTGRRDGELVSVLPLARYRGTLRSCSNVYSPVFDGVSAKPSDLQPLVSAAVRKSRRGLVLRHLDTEGWLSTALRLMAQETRSRFVVLETIASPFVAPNLGWEEFEKTLTKSRRQTVRTTRRRLSEVGEIAVETTDGVENLEAHLDEFLRLEGSGWKVEQGTAVSLVSETESFYKNIAAWAAKNGLLRMSFMRVGGHQVAVEYQIDDGARRYLLKIGYDPEYARYGPGVLLQLAEVRTALEDGRTFELGPGLSKVKKELMNAQRTIEHVAVFPRSPRGVMARRTLETRQAVYQRARESTRLRRTRDRIRAILTRQRLASEEQRNRPPGRPARRKQARAS